MDQINFTNEDLVDLLKETGKFGDFVKWNDFRKKNRKLTLVFEQEDFSHLNFDKFNFQKITFKNCDLQGSIFSKTSLNNSNLEESNLFGSFFKECFLVSSNLSKCVFSTSNFEDCDMRFVNFKESQVHQAHFERCRMMNSIFLDASINDSNILACDLSTSDFRGCEVLKTDLSATNFTASYVDGKTIFWDCFYDIETNFTGVGLTSCRIEPVLSSSFSCNIRRFWWKEWYKKNKIFSKQYLNSFLKNPISNFFDFFNFLSKRIMTFVVKMFWWITDYGSSTIRLLTVFAIITFAFTLIYINVPEMTSDEILNNSNDINLVFFRGLYFSIIVMTSVGFGDINAFSQSAISHFIISAQALSGFILLGAFLVRIGILFQGEFPVSSERKRER